MVDGKFSIKILSLEKVVKKNKEVDNEECRKGGEEQIIINDFKTSQIRRRDNEKVDTIKRSTGRC